MSHGPEALKHQGEGLAQSGLSRPSVARSPLPAEIEFRSFGPIDKDLVHYFTG